LASGSVISTGALAFVSSHNVDASASVFARVVKALVDISLAIASFISGKTLTPIAVDVINALSINARVVDAVIVVLFAVFTPSSG
jgi:hypothetical protein